MARTNTEWASLIKEKIFEVSTLPKFSRATPASTLSNDGLALTIDHTLLKPDATQAQIDELCDQALKYKFKSCCVNGTHVERVAQRLKGSSSIACCVIGFPLGAGSTISKAFEAAQAVSDGAKEIDMVINIGALKAGNYASVYEDIRAVVDASAGNVVKVILETVFLSDEEKVAAAFISAEAGAVFVKTCTGFSGGGASAADVSLIKKSVAYKTNVLVKASAGIRSYEKCLEMLDAGADRIGTSSSIAIIEKVVNTGGTY